jgi:protein-L-isoaspartate(D-aspartate) O-methyltransferase
MHTNQQLIDHLIHAGVLHSSSLIAAFEKCDRILFVPEELHTEAYGDYPLQIGAGQTISQPYTVAIMLEMLHPRAGDKILDIGSGSGWTTALLATAIGENGFVEGIERVSYLVEYGRKNLKKMHITNASIELAQSSVLGKPGNRYDRILISASAPHMPLPLFDQLKPDGILVIPVGNSIWRITKDQTGKISTYELPGFVFVPLIVPY